MSQLTGIIGHTDRELLPCPNLTRIIHSRTTTVGVHTLNGEFTAFVLYFKRGSHRLLIASTSTLNSLGGNLQLLRESH